MIFKNKVQQMLVKFIKNSVGLIFKNIFIIVLNSNYSQNLYRSSYQKGLIILGDFSEALSLKADVLKKRMGWLKGLEPSTIGITIQLSV